MDIKFDFNDLIKKISLYRKEILVSVLYIIAFLSLALLMNNVNMKLEDAKRDEKAQLSSYNKARKINKTEEELQNCYNELNNELKELEERAPSNLDEKQINLIMADINKNTGNLYKMGTFTPKKQDNNSYSIDSIKISGYYSQVEKFLEYIENCKQKIRITKLDITKYDTGTFSGTISLVLYGSKDGAK